MGSKLRIPEVGALDPAEVPGGNTEFLLEGPEETGVVAEANLPCNFLDRKSVV